MSIFKACDIRALYPQEMDASLARAIGAAIGTELQTTTCVLGGDVRKSTPTLKEAICAGLLGAGVDVTDVGIVPTPVVYWAKRRFGTRGAVIVTASHNPPDYNGVKFMLCELPVTPQDVKRIERRVERGDLARGRGTRTRRDVRDEYLHWLRERFEGTGAGLRVLVDAGNGCASLWAPAAFRSAGYEVVQLNCRPDGSFPNRPPDPSKPENLKATGLRVQSAGVDFAACFDGDGDRVAFLDERGAFVQGDRAIILLARAVLRANPGAAIVYDLKCSKRVAQQIRRAGGRPLMERSGHAFIKSRMIREGAAFAGEASGHYFYGEIGGDDGLYAALKMGQLLKAAGRPLSELAAAIPGSFISPDIRVPVASGGGEQIVERLRAEFAPYPQDHTDGVRIDFGDGWALCRPSVTEPAITLRFEAETAERLEQIKKLVMCTVCGAGTDRR